MGDILAFRRMLTPALIQGIFWVLVVLCVIVGLGFTVWSWEFWGTPGGIVGTLGSGVLTLCGILAARIACELVILFFRMNETLTSIKNAVEEPMEDEDTEQLPNDFLSR